MKPALASQLPALILAGRRSQGDDPMAFQGVAHKAFLPLHDRPMLQYVLSALDSADHIGAISICAPGDLTAGFRQTAPGTTILPSADSPSQSVGACLTHFQDAEAVIVTTSDHPLLTPQIVNQFIARARATEADVAVGCVTKSVFQDTFPTAKRTFVKLRDLEFSGANLFYVQPRKAAGLMQYWQQLEEQRKNPLTMARMIGFGTGLRYLFGRLTHAQLVGALFKRSGTRCIMVPLDDPTAAIDVDKPADIALAASLLEA